MTLAAAVQSFQGSELLSDRDTERELTMDAPTEAPEEYEGTRVATIIIGDRKFINAKELASALGIPRHHIITAVRDPETPLSGQRIGLAWLIDAESFYEWIRKGKFGSRYDERDELKDQVE
jgi:hypothetical protein